jgi:hypothetical protein
VLVELLGTHVGVGQERGPGETGRLDLSRAFDALLNSCRRLAWTAIRQLLVRDARHTEMDVDAVQQRPTDPLLDWVITPGRRSRRAAGH